MSSREQILNKLRAARRPFEDAAPQPAQYLAVTIQDDLSPPALLDRFCVELTNLKGEPIVVDGEDAAREKVLELLAAHGTKRLLAWEFQYLPIARMEAAIRSAGIDILVPDVRDEDRPEMLALAEQAQVGLTGADAAAAATGTLIVTTAPGKGRIPTVLAPVHLAVIRADQIVPRIESWVAQQRSAGMAGIRSAGNVCFITGPSRTGDIEMELILGVHGPGRVQVVIIR
jgi:L-lactate dehydrogenase complex protein LldG